MNESTVLTIVAIAAAAGLVTWARWYAKRHYPYFLCAVCKGSNKRWEPRWLMWLCLRFRRRRFDNCPACNGGKITA